MLRFTLRLCTEPLSSAIECLQGFFGCCEGEAWVVFTDHCAALLGNAGMCGLLEYEMHFIEQSLSGRKVRVFRPISSQASTT